jgi:hypothetical protein
MCVWMASTGERLPRAPYSQALHHQILIFIPSCRRWYGGADITGLSRATRWSINAFSYLRNVTKKYRWPIPKFDEPAIGIDWPTYLAPHRVGVVGESLFVHCQVSGRDAHTHTRTHTYAHTHTHVYPYAHTGTHASSLSAHTC